MSFPCDAKLIRFLSINFFVCFTPSQMNLAPKFNRNEHTITHHKVPQTHDVRKHTDFQIENSKLPNKARVCTWCLIYHVIVPNFPQIQSNSVDNSLWLVQINRLFCVHPHPIVHTHTHTYRVRLLFANENRPLNGNNSTLMQRTKY